MSKKESEYKILQKINHVNASPVNEKKMDSITRSTWCLSFILNSVYVILILIYIILISISFIYFIMVCGRTPLIFISFHHWVYFRFIFTLNLSHLIFFFRGPIFGIYWERTAFELSKKICTYARSKILYSKHSLWSSDCRRYPKHVRISQYQ